MLDGLERMPDHVHLPDVEVASSVAALPCRLRERFRCGVVLDGVIASAQSALEAPVGGRRSASSECVNQSRVAVVQRNAGSWRLASHRPFSVPGATPVRAGGSSTMPVPQTARNVACVRFDVNPF